MCDIFSPFLLVLNHICQPRIKVACKVAKSFLTLFPVTLVKVEVQESSLHQMNCKKVYFLTCLMQNVQKLNMVGCRALNDRSNHYGPPCRNKFISGRAIFSGLLREFMNVKSLNIWNWYQTAKFKPWSKIECHLCPDFLPRPLF